MQDGTFVAECVSCPMMGVEHFYDGWMRGKMLTLMCLCVILIIQAQWECVPKIFPQQ